ncbi:MAG: hypothetical protein HYV26_12780, partial [Candidatus Hydrogenedentes bacterium]|nr:hypothetical protein [Candidatus Hydrogenedentota bacterium]
MGAHTAGNIEEAGHARRSRSTWRRWRGWLLLAAAFTIFLALGSLDQRLKKAPYGGFCPPDPDWSFAAADLPQFWARLSATAPLEHSRDALRPYTGEFQLRVRLAT